MNPFSQIDFMATIAYTGLAETSQAALHQLLGGAGDSFIEVSEDQAREKLSELASQADVYLIGERVGNPIKLAQTAQALDNLLSVLIFNDQDHYEKIKQALLFTPFISNAVKSLPSDASQRLMAATREAITKTQQRRNYKKLTTTAVLQQPQVQNFEAVRSEYLDTFLDEAPIGAVLMTEKGLILAVNRYATKILGTNEKDLIGAPFATLFTEADQQGLWKLLSGSGNESDTFETERSVQLERRHLSIRVAKITIQEGIPYRLGILHDITEATLAQQKITQQLSTLREVNAQLTRANADLDAFVYAASHDLKAPIANIEGLIELIRRKIEITDPQLYTLFAMLEVSIDRFLNTIKDLTEVALIQQRDQSDQQVSDAQEVIDEVQMLIMEMIIGADATLQIDCPSGFEIQFSRSNFRSLLFNLLSNALKYRSPERETLIKISLKREAPYCLLTVEDNGMGIAPEKQKKMFEMFRRFHVHIEGTGIGLFIVKRIIDITGSKIEVTSTEGQGTTFRLYLNEQSVPGKA